MVNSQKRDIKNSRTVFAGVEIFFAKLSPLFFCYVPSISRSFLKTYLISIVPIVSSMCNSKFILIAFSPFRSSFNVFLLIKNVIALSTTNARTKSLPIWLELSGYKLFATLQALLFTRSYWWRVLKTPVFFQAKRTTIFNGFIVRNFSSAYKLLPVIREFFMAICAGRHIHTSYAIS